MNKTVSVLLSKPYDLLEHKRFKLLGTFGSITFVFLFLLIFQPFGFHELSFKKLLQSLGLYNICALPILIIHVFFLQHKLIKHFTIGKTILWLAWILLLVSTSNYFVNSYLFMDGKLTIISFFYLLGSTTIEAVIPISIIILLHYNYVLKKRYENSKAINESIALNHKTSATKKVFIKAQNPQNNLMLDSNSLLYIKSEGNYIDVFYCINNKVEHKLLRSTLTKTEESLRDSAKLFRCHKSYLVNMNKIDEVQGNSIGYFIMLSGIEKQIPVSRKFNSSIQGMFASK